MTNPGRNTAAAIQIILDRFRRASETDLSVLKINSVSVENR